MHTLFDPIKCITPWRETWRLRVKVVRLWFDGNSVLEENDDGLLHLILMDLNLDKIEAIIKECFISDVVDVLDQGSVYIMTNFSIVPNIGSNRVTQHRFKLLFQEETTITPGVPFSALNDGFSFCPISEILEKRGDSDYLIDFVGVITGVHPDKEINYCGKMIKVVILELYADGKKIQCNVFGKSCECLEFSMLTKFQRPPIIILQSFKIKVYGDRVSLQNVLNISNILINPDLQETVHFLERMNVASCHFNMFTKNDHGSLVSNIDDDSLNWRCIRTIQVIQENTEDGLFFVVAKVKEIFGGANWWLFSCVCGHSLDQVDNVFHCHVCDRDVDNAIAKYRVRIVVEDRNATAVFVLMDSAATKLFGKTCSSALMDHEKELNDFSYALYPTFFDLFIGKELIFKIDCKKVSNEPYTGTFKVISILNDNLPHVELKLDPNINSGIQAPIYTPICEDYHHYAEVEKYKSRIACDAFIHACNVDDMLLDSFAVRYYHSTPEPVCNYILVFFYIFRIKLSLIFIRNFLENSFFSPFWVLFHSLFSSF
ncbi:hypothetical protein AHAS_Ahas03G0311500 [Arachis hypogaea]